MMPALLHYALVLFFAWLLATAALHKFRHRDYYAGLIQAYIPAANGPAAALALAIGIIEFALAACLVVAPLRTAAFVGAAVLLTGYLALMAWHLLNSGADINCGCAGPASDLKLSPALLLRNAVLIALALAGTLPAAGAGISAGLLANVLAAGLFLIVIYLCIEQLLLNAQRFREGWG